MSQPFSAIVYKQGELDIIYALEWIADTCFSFFSWKGNKPFVCSLILGKSYNIHISIHISGEFGFK